MREEEKAVEALRNVKLRKSAVPLFITKTLVNISNILPNWMNKKNLKTLLKIYEKKGCKFVHIAIPNHFFTNLSTLEFYGEISKFLKKQKNIWNIDMAKIGESPKEIIYLPKMTTQ